ncbi:MAG TPA: helix-turn-helix domain-containing protein, partial [Thermoleophilaceae bacterium]
MTASQTISRSRLSRDERMRQSVSVARALFAEHGYAAVTMDAVAAEMGVTKPLLYTYFGNKEQLYVACMEPAGDALLASIVKAVEATATPDAALRAGLLAFFDFVDQDRSAWRVLFDETLPASGEVAARVGEYRERLNALIAAALLDQLPARRRSKAKVEVEALSTALMAAAEGLARWWLRTEALSSAA